MPPHLAPLEVPGAWRTRRAADIAGDTALRRLGPDNVLVELLEPRRIWYGAGREDSHTCPAGLISDGASIPRLLRRLFDPDRGRHWPPALMHDHYYATALVDRLTADRRFRDAMALHGVDYCTRTAMYIGLRLCGWRAWNTHRRRERLTAPPMHRHPDQIRQQLADAEGLAATYGPPPADADFATRLQHQSHQTHLAQLREELADSLAQARRNSRDKLREKLTNRRPNQ